jgi:hypothetical protein
MTTLELEAIVIRAMAEPVPDWSTREWNVVDALRSAGVVAHTEHGPCPKGWGLCACNEDWAPVAHDAQGNETYPRSDRGHIFDGICCDAKCRRDPEHNYCEAHDG